MAADALSLLPADPTDVVAFRWSSYDVPFWARPNTRPGRWNRLGDDPTQYWSLSPDAAWAELIRHENLRSEAELDLVRMSFWICRVPTMRLIDLRHEAERDKYDLAEDALIADDWRECQELRAVLQRRAAGVIAPCAALPDEPNLTLFGARRAIDFDARPALASAVPVAKAAIGRPPDGLVERVRRPAGPPATGTLF